MTEVAPLPLAVPEVSAEISEASAVIHKFPSGEIIETVVSIEPTDPIKETASDWQILKHSFRELRQSLNSVKNEVKAIGQVAMLDYDPQTETVVPEYGQPKGFINRLKAKVQQVKEEDKYKRWLDRTHRQRERRIHLKEIKEQAPVVMLGLGAAALAGYLIPELIVK